MIIKRTKNFSNLNSMVNSVVEKLDKNRIDDFEIVNGVPKDIISVSGSLDRLRINIPRHLEFHQYDIDDFIRSVKPHFRTSTYPERDLYVMKLSGALSADQCYKLIKFIIDLEGFCAIVEQ